MYMYNSTCTHIYVHVHVYVGTDGNCVYVIMHHPSQMLTIKLHENDCFAAWVMANNTIIDDVSGDIKCETCVHSN